MTRMNNDALKVLFFNAFGIALIVVGLLYNVIQPVFLDDSSHICYLIALTQSWIVSLSIFGCFKPNGWTRDNIKFEEQNLYLYGLIGTLIGLLFLVHIISASTAAIGSTGGDMLPKILNGLGIGLQTSFGPTLCGIISWVWTRRLLFLTRPRRTVKAK